MFIPMLLRNAALSWRTGFLIILYSHSLFLIIYY